MRKTGIEKRRIVGITEDLDFLRRLEKEIRKLYPDCIIDKVATAANGDNLKPLAPNDLIVWEIAACPFAERFEAEVCGGRPILILQNSPGSAENPGTAEDPNVLRHVEKGNLEQVIRAVQDVFKRPRRSGAFRSVSHGFERVVGALTQKGVYEFPEGDDKLFFY